ncbi:hypothetical protein [Stenotrophomonas maltophilia]|uniref:hypothetical protein n=1 Tax=Stenotrophomonas maltophilia TaxID=40324 RepID=UPI00117F4E8D|nr:hypothetical protein [Stenotrophomonas maltophilia]
MSSMKEQVVAGVIVAAIGAVAGAIWASFAGWWPSIFGALRGLWNWLGSSSEHPNWLLILLWLSALAVAFVLVALAIERLRGPVEAKTTWRSYRRDHFHGVNWQWWYEDYSGGVEGLTPLCPSCQCQLVRESPNYFNSNIAFTLHCKYCERNVGEFKENYDETLRDIRLLIQRKIRTNEWQDVVGNARASG